MRPQDLRRTRLFRGLSDELLSHLVQLAREIRFERGDIIFAEGSPGDTFLLIHDGEVQISKDVPGFGDEIVAILSGGECLGEMSLVDDAPRSAEALAMSDWRCSVIKRSDLEALLRDDQGLAHEFLWSLVRELSGRLREMNAKMTLLSAAGKF